MIAIAPTNSRKVSFAIASVCSSLELFLGNYFLNDFAHLFVADVGVESVVANALRAFGENVLNHAPCKFQNGQG